MNLGSARTELQARGYSRFTSSRLNQWLNDAKDQFEDVQADWQWLRATATGSAPLTINDLRRVLYVMDSSNLQQLTRLSQAEVAELVDPQGLLTTTGPPGFWYLTSDTALAVYPVQAVSLSVRYVKFSPTLSGDSDTPLIPSRYHGVWVDLAEAHVLRYGVKDAASAQVIEQAALGRVRQIAVVYAMQDRPELDEQPMTWESVDG